MKAKLKVKLGGLHCGACALATDDAVEQLTGVSKSKTNVARGYTKVLYDDEIISPEQIHQAISAAGYAPHPKVDRLFDS